MATTSNPPTLDETINELGQRTLDLKARMRTLMWAALPFVLVMVGVLIVDTPSHRANSEVVLLCEGLAALPALVALGAMVMAQGRLQKTFKGLQYTSTPNLDDVRSIASPAAIGPLLQGTLAASTITSAWDHGAIDSATALLDALLRSVQPEDQVVLTADQRQRLQELVLPGMGDALFKGAGGVGGKSTVALQRLRDRLCPAAVSALGVLGDSSAVPLLERFAGKTGNTNLRQSALQSVAQIQERMKYGPEQLLRADSAP